MMNCRSQVVSAALLCAMCLLAGCGGEPSEPALDPAEANEQTAVLPPQPLHVVSWNAQSLFSVAGVSAREGDLKRLTADLSPDLLLLDEVTSLAVVEQVGVVMELEGYHAACSDFAQDDAGGYESLEVGILSRYPLANVVEFDQTPDNTGAPGEPAESRLERASIEGIADAPVTRGFLAADIPDLGLTVIVTHLKSSRGLRGEDDRGNAQKREFVAAAIARFIHQKLAADAGATIVLGGDFNVGETDAAKNGFRLEEDVCDPAEGDLYDDTHAILTAGLIDGLHLISLTRGVGETYDSSEFRGTGPIDCLFTAGAQSGDFSLAKKAAATYGSDHFPVWSRFYFSGKPPAASPPGPSLRIAALLYDPVEKDDGKEYVTLHNHGAESVDLMGWKIRDKAQHSVSLSGLIAPGENRKINLAAGEMPLNNTGDTVELLDPAGEVVHQVSYRGSHAPPGVEVRFSP